MIIGKPFLLERPVFIFLLGVKNPYSSPPRPAPRKNPYSSPAGRPAKKTILVPWEPQNARSGPNKNLKNPYSSNMCGPPRAVFGFRNTAKTILKGRPRPARRKLNPFCAKHTRHGPSANKVHTSLPSGWPREKQSILVSGLARDEYGILFG